MSGRPSRHTARQLPHTAPSPGSHPHSPSAAGAIRTAISTVRDAGGTGTFDANYRARLWRADQATEVLRELTASADIVFAGEDKARMITGATIKAENLAAALCDYGPTTAVVTADRSAPETHSPPATSPPYPMDTTNTHP